MPGGKITRNVLMYFMYYVEVIYIAAIMKAEVHIDTQELEEGITRRVIQALKPLLQGRPEDDTIFTVSTLAEYLHVSDQWVYERVHLKEIPYIKMGKFPRFRKSEVDRWMDTMKTPAINPLSRPLKMLKAAYSRA